MMETSETQFKLQRTPAKRLKVFITEEDRYSRRRLYHAILRLLYDAGVSYATVFKGVEGFGERRLVHTIRNEVLSLNLPITIEATGAPEKIDSVIPEIAAMMTSGLLETSNTSVFLPMSEK